MQNQNNPPGIPRRSRWSILIYPRFQLTVLAVNLVTAVLVFFGIGLAIGRSFTQLKNQGLALGLPTDHAYFSFLEHQTTMVYSSLGIALTIGFVVTAIATLVLSHRLAGPIVRLCRYFQEMLEGKPVRPISFREQDFFSELPPLINEALQRHESHRTRKAA